MLEKLSGIEQAVVAIQGNALDLKAEQERLAKLHLVNAAEVRQLLTAAVTQLGRLGMQLGEVRPNDSLSIHSEDEKRAVKQLLVRFRKLPADEQKQLPALLNGLGKLQVGAGQFEQAKNTFLEVAEEVSDPAAKAEAQFNAYRAALEEKRWDDALAAIRQAAALAPDRFAPFPLHRYELKQLLGAGGFGAVFLCHDRNFGVDVAVKTLHGADMDRSMESVMHEAKALHNLSHPTIIRIRDYDFVNPTTRSRPYLVMDYFPGTTLEKFVTQRGVMPADDLIDVARQLAEAMKMAHEQGVFHRDLKPANVLVHKEGTHWQVRIIDFGLALRQQAIKTTLAGKMAGDTTISRSVAGTIKYAPPEQMGELPGESGGVFRRIFLREVMLLRLVPDARAVTSTLGFATSGLGGTAGVLSGEATRRPPRRLCSGIDAAGQ